MRIIETTSDIEKIKPGCVLTIGNFDGVHLGHQEILTAAGQIAVQKKTKLVVMTFEPHPLIVLQPQKAPGILTPLALKKYLLAAFGVDCLLVLKSTAELLNRRAEDFVRQFLVERIRPAVVVEGRDFNFGVNRQGSVKTFQKFADNNGFEVIVVEPKEVKLFDGQTVRVSSTIIRNMLEEGSVADAAVALSRPYRLIGKVVPGLGKGKKLGFPTANLKPAQQLIPAEGVYAGFVAIANSEEKVGAAKEKSPAAFSIGRTKTYGDYPLLVEAHLLKDNVSNLTGKWLAMDFIERIRSQQKFESEKELSAQIAKDCQKAKIILTTD